MYVVRNTLSSLIQVTDIIREILNFPPNPFIPVWSLLKNLSCPLLPLVLIFLLLLQNVHLQGVAAVCIRTWTLRKWYGISCNTNMFLKKVWHVSKYNMTEERVLFINKHLELIDASTSARLRLLLLVMLVSFVEKDPL